MIFKSYLLEGNFELFNNSKIFLFYGENQGIKKEFKDKLKTINKKKEILSLVQDDIIKNKDILINEIVNKSLFETNKIILIEQATDKVLPILEEIIDRIEEEKIFIFSDLLDKKSKLRNYFEKSKIYGITACYPDNEISIRKIITNKLKGFTGLTSQIINVIIQSTGLDRNKVNNEISKINDYFLDKKIELEKIDLLLNNRSNEDFIALRDEAINGNKATTSRLLADTVFEAENNIYYLNSINQRMNKLNEIERLKKNHSNIELLVTSLKPPVFWKDKPVLINQAKKWNREKIQKILRKTFNTEIEIKSNSAIRKDLLIKNLIVELCLTANSA